MTHKSMLDADLTRVLQIMLCNTKATFKPGQEAVLQAICQGKSRTLVILGIRAGKSIFFYLPASHARAGTTLVIVSMTVLNLAFKRRSPPMGLECVAYEGWEMSFLMAPN